MDLCVGDNWNFGNQIPLPLPSHGGSKLDTASAPFKPTLDIISRPVTDMDITYNLVFG